MSTGVGDGIDSSTGGAITYNSSGNFFVNAAALRATGTGAGLVTVNVTGGQIHSNNHGIAAVANGTGGVLIDMTGGQIGTGAQRVGSLGILASVGGTAGDLTITSTAIFANNTGIVAQINDVAATGDLAVTTNGSTSSLSGDGIFRR